jgi:hypothetical protein
MAHALIPRLVVAAIACAWCETALAGAATPVGAPAVDPTRPPAAAMAPAEGLGEPVAPTLVLQSVLVGPDRQVAVISGVPVSIGEQVLGHTLVRVTTSEARLRGPEGPVILKLIPGVERRTVKVADSRPMKPSWNRRKSKP